MIPVQLTEHMGRILIVAATRIEIAPLMKTLGKPEPLAPNLIRYQYQGQDTVVLVTGIGMMLTAYYLGRYLHDGEYTMAINAGIAGAYGKELNIGEVVEVTSDHLPELGVQEGTGFITLSELGLSGADDFPFDHTRMVNTNIPPLPSGLQFRQVSGNTVNTIRADREGFTALRTRTGADIETMEGAAFLHACLTENIPCLQLRAISNYVEERDKTRWDVPLAIKNLNEALLKILNIA